MVFPDISNSFFVSFFQAAARSLREKGYNILLGNSDDELAAEEAQLRIFGAQSIDGLIIAPTAGDHKFLKAYVNDYPVVFIDRKPVGYDAGDYVTVDNERGANRAVSFLIEKGHKRIGIIAGMPGLTTTYDRLEGYRHALGDFGIPFDERLVKIGDSRINSGYQLTCELLESTDITALFVANNLMTIGSMYCLREKAVRIPEDLAIIGFDDCEWAGITDPPLSVVKQPTHQMGIRCTEVILDRLTSNEYKEFETYCLPTELVIRDSC